MTQLLVPPHGMVRIPGNDDLPGKPVLLEVDDPHWSMLVKWTAVGEPNDTARRMLAGLTGMHVVFVGDVLFCNLTGALLRELLALR